MQPDGHDGPAPAAPHADAPAAVPAPRAPVPADGPPPARRPSATIDLTGKAAKPADADPVDPPPADAPAVARPRRPEDGGPATIEMVLDLDRPPGTTAGAEPVGRPRRPTDTDHLGPPIGRHRASGRQHHWLALAMVCLAVGAIAVAVIGGWGRARPAPDTLPPSTGVPTVEDTDPVVVPGPTLTGPTPTPTRTTTPTRRTTPSATPSPVASVTASTRPTATATRTPTPSPTPTGPSVLPIPPHTVTVFAASGQCLDDSAQVQADGNRVQAWECNNTDAQHWTFGADGTLRYHSLCLRPAGASAVSGALMQTRTCTGANQVWQFRSDKSVYNPNSGLCLTDPGTDPHNQLTLSTCTGSTRQQWTVV